MNYHTKLIINRFPYKYCNIELDRNLRTQSGHVLRERGFIEDHMGGDHGPSLTHVHVGSVGSVTY